MPRFPRTLFLTLLMLLATAGPASAASDLLVGIADDGVTQRSPTLGGLAIPQWQADGVDVARVMIIWNYIAPGRDALSQPSGFNASDPNDPQYNWSDPDRTIAQLVAAGIKPIITVTGPAPIWGSSVPSRRQSRYKPDATKFAAFAKAAAQRYAAVTDQYILWNEPNIDQWMQPQSDCVRKRCTPAAPAIYRGIANKAIPAIKAGDPGAQVFFPALAPRGVPTPTSRNANLKPLTFLRALGCVDAKNRREHKSAHCRTGFKAVDGDGIAYHPHGVLNAPDQSFPDKDTASFADLSRLYATVDGIQKAGGFLHNGSKTSKFNFYFTEFGYETNPPDPVRGVTLDQQNRFQQQAAYLSWRAPRIKMLMQYLWRDDAVGPSKFSGWQSGLFGFDGRAKPWAKGFPNPFWVDLPRGKRSATVWGQVRPGTTSQVTIQRRLPGSSTWTTIKQLQTDARGYFSLKQTVPSGSTSFRFRYDSTVGAPSLTIKPGIPLPDPSPSPDPGGASPVIAQAAQVAKHTVTSSAWTVKPLSARAAKHRRR